MEGKMALINRSKYNNTTLLLCNDCNREISTRATICPYCGAPTKYGQKKEKRERDIKRGNVQGAGCLLMVISIILGLTVIGIPFAVVLFFIGGIILLVGLFT